MDSTSTAPSKYPAAKASSWSNTPPRKEKI